MHKLEVGRSAVHCTGGHPCGAPRTMENWHLGGSQIKVIWLAVTKFWMIKHSSSKVSLKQSNIGMGMKRATDRLYDCGWRYLYYRHHSWLKPSICTQIWHERILWTILVKVRVSLWAHTCKGGVSGFGGHLSKHVSGIRWKLDCLWLGKIYVPVNVTPCAWNRLLRRQIFTPTGRTMKKWSVYFTPCLLHRLHGIPSALCSRCGTADGTFFHLMWECPPIRKYWSEVTAFISSIT